MITDKNQFAALIRDSLLLAITPAGYLEEMTPFGARLMHELSTTGFFLPPFAALDIATAFFTASIGSFTFRARSRLSHKRSKSFERRYHNDYHAYLQWVRGIPEVKRLSLFLAGKDGESKQQLEQSVLLEVLQDIAVQCPFIRVLPWADQVLFATMEWPGAPTGKVLDELREFHVLAVLGLNGCMDPDFFSPQLLKHLLKAGILMDEKNTSFVSFERTITSSRELAMRLDDKEIGEQEACTFYFLQTLIPSFDPETARGDVAMMG
ncbi:MAG: hypothetical protein QNL05_06235, partial [Gammaproteobacteria bacterium]|nr:hypothetical protein [Gammaproteobacteria bacterium]